MWIFVIKQIIFTIGIGVFAYNFISLSRKFLLHAKIFVLSVSGRLETDFTGKYGSWAVVTGASAGIGLAFSKELASRRMNIALISNEEEDLKRAAAEIESEFSVQTKIIHVDFTSGEHVYEIIEKELEDLQIGILVNNVGIYKIPAPALQMKADFMQKMVTVNCIPVVMMTKLILPEMIENRRGAIVNVSSIVDQQPTPSLALYSATKVKAGQSFRENDFSVIYSYDLGNDNRERAFVTVFTKAIQFEYRGSGVTFQILSPGGVNTIKTKNGNKLFENNIFLPGPTDYVRESIKTLGVLDHTAGYHLYNLLSTLLEMYPSSWRTILTGYFFSRITSKKCVQEIIDKME